MRTTCSDILYWLCRDRSVAEDLSQETFTRAWSAWETQRDEKATKAWLFTIARNEHARLYEKKRLDIDPDVELDAIVSKSASDPALGIDVRRAFRPPSRDLPRAASPQVLGGLSSNEIAGRHGQHEDAVNMRLSRARKALKTLLEGKALPTGKEGAR
jgi:RNA polymerase sigma-70 factor (ECF subfamily)